MEHYVKQLTANPSTALFDEMNTYIIERASAQLAENTASISK